MIEKNLKNLNPETVETKTSGRKSHLRVTVAIEISESSSHESQKDVDLEETEMTALEGIVRTAEVLDETEMNVGSEETGKSVEVLEEIVRSVEALEETVMTGTVQVTGVVDHQGLIVTSAVVTETGTLVGAIVTETLDEEIVTGTGTLDEEIVTGNLEEETETETSDVEVTVTLDVRTVSAGVKTATWDVVTVDSVVAWMMTGVDPQEQMMEVLGEHQDLLLPEIDVMTVVENGWKDEMINVVVVVVEEATHGVHVRKRAKKNLVKRSHAHLAKKMKMAGLL
ncbi:hypothetical protein C7M84_012985 [Penaeus vannamei]|uniref:Uncharacterized protein n=1 Tax=Penaeus vannamei TaxID=6689 RepID=A0A3R7Q557_PENVA|nr:hypothetical protein C7M84_012985 [Penaeus vannamei]